MRSLWWGLLPLWWGLLPLWWGLLPPSRAVQGLENYSRHLCGRPAGSAPLTLLDYFPPEFTLVVDESHVALPQVGGAELRDGEGSRCRRWRRHSRAVPCHAMPCLALPCVLIPCHALAFRR